MKSNCWAIVFAITGLVYLWPLTAAAQDRVTRQLTATGLTTQDPVPPFPNSAGGVDRWAQQDAADSSIVRPRIQVTGAAAAVNANANPLLNRRTTLETSETVRMRGLAGANVNVYLTANILGTIQRNAGGVTTLDYSASLAPAGGGAAIASLTPAQFNAAGAVDRFLVARALNAASDDYQLTTRAVLNASTAAGTAGMINNVDFNTIIDAGMITEQHRGMLARAVASPRGLANSRDAVGVSRMLMDPRLRIGPNAPDGSGIRLGVLELGRPYDNHTAMAGLVVDPQAANAFYADEHALAVAGIIGGRSGVAEQRGIAPGASIDATAFPAYSMAGESEDQQILRAVAWLVDSPIPVDAFNGSFGIPRRGGVRLDDGDSASARLYDWLVDTRRQIIVVSAGNSGANGAPQPGDVGLGNPAISSVGNSIGGGDGGYNVITVGALDYNFQSKAYFSSFGPTNTPAGQPRVKPDIVAPGVFILSPVAADLDNDTMMNDFERIFFGVDDLRRPADTRIGGSAINGTSFAAPHVTGGVGLMLQYGRSRDGRADGDRTDPRVVKAALLNTAYRNPYDPATNLKHRDGTGWSQGGITIDANGILIREPLDSELGAGLMAIDSALLQIQPREARVADDIPAAGMATNIPISTRAWDRQQIDSNAAGMSRTVWYTVNRGLVRGQRVRATQVWNRRVAADDGNLTVEPTDTFTPSALSNLDLRLWYTSPAEDVKNGAPAFLQRIRSASPNDNVELIDSKVDRNGEYFLQAFNNTARADEFAMAIEIGSNSAATAGLLSPDRSNVPEEGPAHVAFEPTDVESAYGVVMKPTFRFNDLFSGADQIYIMDDNQGFEYQPGSSYNIYIGPELRSDSADPSSDIDWFANTIDLSNLASSLPGWQTLLSSAADPFGNLAPTLISDPVFLSAIAPYFASVQAGALEYNFAIDVNADGLFTPELDGVGWFEIIAVPEPATLVTALIAALVLVLKRRKPHRQQQL